MSRRARRLAAVVLLSVICALLTLVPAIWLSAERFGAYATALQALGVLAAIIIALSTLQSDSRDRRVDRTIGLHEQLTSGDIGDARRRLARHLRDLGNPAATVRRTAMSSLRDDAQCSRYDPVLDGRNPFDDVEVIVRFFERCRLVHLRGSVDEPLFVELLGRHAAWWNKALLPDHTNARRALAELATWAEGCAAANRGRYHFLANWGLTRAADFPDADESNDAEPDPPVGVF
jgi:hypothetical protein